MKIELKPAFAIAAVVVAAGISALSQTAHSSTPQPNIVRLVRVGEGRWEGTACWPADAGPGPHCFRTSMTGWEPKDDAAVK